MADPDAAVALEPLMSIDEVAGVLRISESGVYRLISGGQLITLKVGNRTLFEPAEVRKFIASHRQPADSAPGEDEAT